MNKLTRQDRPGVSGWVFQNEQSVIVPDINKDERFVKTNSYTLSGIYVPLKAGNRTIGSIGVENSKRNAFSEKDLRFLETVGSQAATAFENARLYQEAVKSAERSSILQQAGQDIANAGLDQEKIYQTLHKAIEQLMPMDVLHVVLVDKERNELRGVYLIQSKKGSLR